MVLDTSKKPIGQSPGATTEGGTAQKRLDLNKKPIAASGSTAGPAAPAGDGRKGDPPPRRTLLAWFLAAVAAVVGLGFLTLPHIGGKKPDVGSGGASADAASRKLAGEAPDSNATGAAASAAPVSQFGTGSAGGPSAGKRPVANDVTGEQSSPNAATGGDSRPPAEPGREESTAGRAENLASKPSAGDGHVTAGTTAGGRDGASKATPSSDRGVATAGPSKTGALAPKSETRSASEGSIAEAEAKAGRADEGGPVGVVQPQERPPVATTNPGSVLLTVRFALNSSAMTPEEEGRIRSEIGDVAAGAPQGVVVEGFTCDLGSEEFNHDLARRRVDAVAGVIRASAGGAPVRVEERAFGERHPVASNDTESGRRENRRVVVSRK